MLARLHHVGPDVLGPSVLIEELGHFRRAGGRAILEMTVEGIGRDAAKLREISEAVLNGMRAGSAETTNASGPADPRGCPEAG